jgi:arabinan endo-1,5-alpha-L-arabinosidase
MKKLLTVLILLSLLFSCTALADNSSLPAPKFKEVSVHDPSVIRTDDGTFYIYGSHMTAAKSSDLIRWEMFSRNADTGCKLVENVQEEMAEALRYAKTTTFWAPDVQQLKDGRYYLYYCTCEGSSPLSALGVAVSDRPEGPYKDLGIFLKSGGPGYDATTLPNAIDPCVFFDKEDNLWMVYGSYSGGIYILRMDPETGFPLEGQGYGKKLLGKNHARIEGPYILYSPDTDYYYLFLSFGGLNAADGYNIRVCRSRNPDGPYEDALGQDMIDCGGKDGTFFNDPDYEGYGVKLLGGYCFEPLEGDPSARTAYRSPGHNSAFYDPETGRYFIIFHTRFANRGEQFRVRVHQMMMNKDGWPVVLPWRYAGEMPEKVPAQQQAGTYKVILHERDINKTEHSSKVITLNADGTVTGDLTGTWICPDGQTFECELDGIVYHGVMTTAFDSIANAWVPCFSALDPTGAALWGSKRPE